jgi:putative endonuclease
VSGARHWVPGVWVWDHGTEGMFTNVMPAKAGIQLEATVDKQFYVYILASKRNGTLYTGVTSNLAKRLWQHESNMIEGFTKKYDVNLLVYYEVHDNAESAITREKRIKKWRRSWKLRLIEDKNPRWKDLYKEIHF